MLPVIMSVRRKIKIQVSRGGRKRPSQRRTRGQTSPHPGLDGVPRRPPGPCTLVTVLLRQAGLFRDGSLAGRCVCSVIGSVLE